MLSRQALQDYLEPLKPDQIEAITSIRRLIFEHNPSATEEIDEGKWFGGLLTYNTPAGHFLYALGPRKDGSTTFHMMPYYSLPDLPTRHSARQEPIQGHVQRGALARQEGFRAAGILPLYKRRKRPACRRRPARASLA